MVVYHGWRIQEGVTKAVKKRLGSGLLPGENFILKVDFGVSVLGWVDEKLAQSASPCCTSVET